MVFALVVVQVDSFSKFLLTQVTFDKIFMRIVYGGCPIQRPESITGSHTQEYRVLNCSSRPKDEYRVLNRISYGLHQGRS